MQIFVIRQVRSKNKQGKTSFVRNYEFSRRRKERGKNQDLTSSQPGKTQVDHPEATAQSQRSEFEDFKPNFKGFLRGWGEKQRHFLEDMLESDEQDEIEINDAISRISRDTKDFQSKKLDADIQDLKDRQLKITQRREDRLQAFKGEWSDMFHDFYQEVRVWQKPISQLKESQEQVPEAESKSQRHVRRTPPPPLAPASLSTLFHHCCLLTNRLGSTFSKSQYPQQSNLAHCLATWRQHTNSQVGVG